jgi:hypothetical protein
MSEKNRYMAVPELAAQGAGAIVYWRLSSKPVDFEALKTSWREAGLPDSLLLSTPEPETALRRAVSEQRGARRLVRSVKGAHVIVDETAHSKTVERPSDVDYSAQATVKLDKVGRVQVEPYNYKLHAEVKAAYEKSLGEITDSDFSGWFSTKLIAYVQGVTLRPGGGTYFVPRSMIETWNRIIAVVRDVSEHRIFSIPAMESSEAVAAVLDAIEQEAAAEVESMEKDLAAGTLGGRALETRVGRTEFVERKVERYEELLGVRLDAMRQRIHELRAQLTVAARKSDGAAPLEC